MAGTGAGLVHLACQGLRLVRYAWQLILGTQFGLSKRKNAMRWSGAFQNPGQDRPCNCRPRGRIPPFSSGLDEIDGHRVLVGMNAEKAHR